MLWWVPAGHIPSVEEAKERLEQLRLTARHSAPTQSARPSSSSRRDPPAQPRGGVAQAPTRSGRSTRTSTSTRSACWPAESRSGSNPVPYQARYSLDTRDEFETARLAVDVAGRAGRAARPPARSEGGLERIRPTRGARWTCRRRAATPAALGGAVDCDLASRRSPTRCRSCATASHNGGEPRDYEMAWVSLPDLALHDRSTLRADCTGAGPLRRARQRLPGRARARRRTASWRATSAWPSVTRRKLGHGLKRYRLPRSAVR